MAAGSAARWQPPRAAPARRRPAADLLTLPSFSTEVPGAVRLKWREDVNLSDLVLKHFQYGPLRAGDVHDPADAGDAFQQAFHAWTRRQYGRLSRLRFTPHLFDAHAVRDVLDALGNGNNDDDPTPLFFGFGLEDEWVYSLEGAIETLRSAHPLLFRTVMGALYRASARTMFIRLPDWFIYEFSCWYWDGDPNISDEDADEALKERFEDDTETRSAYLPSVVRPQLCPDDADPCVFRGGKWRDRRAMTDPELVRLRARSRGMPRRVCTEVLNLRTLMRRSRTRDLFHVSYDANPVYGICSVIVEDNEFVGDLLDHHFDGAAQCGDATTYSGFSRLASTPKAIRRQYADLALAFRILTHLDRLLALVSQPT
ncbi:PRTRC system protein F [Burkholderia sp. SCN-KJ]|uniref:PRTRC system protein F n=1 Tax=Burkholderia sp. SCN-KJ TaxID=2969248 RepID=UPI00214FEDAE|nr:PRTRC system protein F [Burkholderia sp. SCN-KJ]MCR4470093.1 PRTRC system protein F [Burkholderia sp. SCN-KJ]